MNTRPSKIYGVRPKHVAWSFDRAVQTFGRALEDAMHAASQGAKNDKSANMAVQRVASRWLASADPVDTKARGRFRDPMGG